MSLDLSCNIGETLEIDGKQRASTGR